MQSYPQKTLLSRMSALSFLWRQSSQIRLVLLFFILVFFGLLLGDGKQGKIDIFFSGGLVCLFGCAHLWGVRLSRLPMSLSLAWIVFLVFIAVRTLFSDSVGLSVYVFVRLLAGFLVFWLFFTISLKNILSLVERCFLWLAALASMLSLVFFVFPPAQGDLLLMSLVSPTYGHNHLSVLLVFVFPLVLQRFQKNKSSHIFLGVGYFLSMVLTVSRGAWLIVFGCCLSLLLGREKQSQKTSYWLLLVAGSMVVLFLGTTILGTLKSENVVSGIPTRLEKMVSKPPFGEDGRLEYWRQAVVAFSERPLFGSGPGTFELLSRRLQNESRQFSWFAHNAPLQALAETGLAGGVLLLVLGVVIGQQIAKPYTSPLLVGVGLVGILGLVDFAWDFYVIQLLAAAVLGLHVRQQRQQRQTHTPKTAMVFVVIIFLFYLSYLSSLFAKVVFKNNTLAFWLAPYNKEVVLASLNDARTTSTYKNDARSVFRFYWGDADILTPLVDVASPNKRSSILSRAMWLDPFQLELRRKYILTLYDERKDVDFNNEIIIFLKKKHPVVAKAIAQLDFSLASPPPTLPIGLLLEASDTLALSKALYECGFVYLPLRPDVTKRFWQAAIDISPDWSYFYLELVSLEKGLNRPEIAKEILKKCRENRYAGKHCQEQEENLLDVGIYREAIQSAKP